MSIIPTVIVAVTGVVGTLSGGWLQGRTQLRNARLQATIAEARAEADHRRAQQAAAMEAVESLVEAFDAHRTAMANLEDKRLAEGIDACAEEIKASQATRKAVSVPLSRLRMMVPALSTAALHAKETTFSMHGSPDPDTLDQRRRAALAATEEFQLAANALFGSLGVAVTAPEPPAALAAAQG